MLDGERTFTYTIPIIKNIGNRYEQTTIHQGTK